MLTSPLYRFVLADQIMSSKSTSSRSADGDVRMKDGTSSSAKKRSKASASSSKQNAGPQPTAMSPSTSVEGTVYGNQNPPQATAYAGYPPNQNVGNAYQTSQAGFPPNMMLNPGYPVYPAAQNPPPSSYQAAPSSNYTFDAPASTEPGSSGGAMSVDGPEYQSQVAASNHATTVAELQRLAAKDKGTGNIHNYFLAPTTKVENHHYHGGKK